MKKEDKIILEYQKTQDSAEHYNTMVWTLISVGIGLSLTILYLVASQEQDILLEILMLFIGMFVLFYFSYLIEAASEKRSWKYYVCRRLEKENAFIGQNLKIDLLPLSKARLWGISRFGMGIFRLMKMLLYILYITALIIAIANLYKMHAANYIIWISIVFTFLALIGSIIIEIWYWTIKYDFDEIWKLPAKDVVMDKS